MPAQHPDPPTAPDDRTDDWSPRQGFARAVAAGLIAAALLAAASGFVAWHAPLVLLNLWVRLAFAFGVT